MTEPKRKLISIVVPVYNEELNIESCYNALSAIAEKLDQYDFEFVFTDNHSEDDSYKILENIASSDSRVRAFLLSKNFGYQRSIYTGLSKTKGDAVIVFDCDLQDPPELLPEFIVHWEQGYHVVYGVRIKRKESRLMEATRKIFYRLINALSEDPLPLDSGDFRLLDREIINAIKSIKEQQPYLRGIVASLGYQQIGIPYSRNERTAGKSKFRLKSLVGLAIDGIVSQSTIPLRISTYVGMATSLITLILILGYTFTYFFHSPDWPRGFTTTTILLLFSISLNALFLGVIGEYLARIYKQVRGRPITLIEKSTDMVDLMLAKKSKEQTTC